MFGPYSRARVRAPLALRALLACALVAGMGGPRPVRAQDPAQLQARLEQLQRDERAILDERNWWAARLNDPEILFLPPLVGLPQVTSFFSPPVMISRASAWELAQHHAAAYVALRVQRARLAHELMGALEGASQTMKEETARTLLPAFDRDLQQVRDEFQRLMAQRDRAGQTPRTGPPGRAWYFRRAVVGADRTSPDFQLLDQDADESGGRVQVRGRVPSTNCFETWEMSWRFGANVSRLQAGMRIPVTLHAQLVSAPCPSPLGSFIDVGGGGMERVITGQAPSPVLQVAVEEQAQRCAANGTTREATTQATLVVRGNPGQSNAWTAFRFQVYMPGQFWVVGYLYLAGGG